MGMQHPHHILSGTALVTGASSGMGAEFARQLAAMGIDLALVSNRGAELEGVAGDIRARFGVTVRTLCADLARNDAASEVYGWCREEGIRPDILINNAGMFFMEYLSPALMDKAQAMMTLHMETVTGLCILFGADMKERGSGRILNMSSMTASIPAPGIAIYSASKAYLKSFGKSLSYEMRPFGVSVTTVCPAAVDTGLYPLGDRLRKFLKSIGIIRTPEHLVRRALRALARGRRTLAPGIVNALLPPIIAILPNRLIDRLGMRWIYRRPTSDR